MTDDAYRPLVTAKDRLMGLAVWFEGQTRFSPLIASSDFSLCEHYFQSPKSAQRDGSIIGPISKVKAVTII